MTGEKIEKKETAKDVEKNVCNAMIEAIAKMTNWDESKWRVEI